MNYPWYNPDCNCIDCHCIKIGITPLPGTVMHDIWKKQKENLQKRLQNNRPT